MFTVQNGIVGNSTPKHLHMLKIQDFRSKLFFCLFLRSTSERLKQKIKKLITPLKKT